MNETYTIKVTCIREDLFEAVVESPALRVEAPTFKKVMLEIERALVKWRLDQDRKPQQTAIPA